ncbi:MAG: hypothetical protein AB8H86_20365 [Polyangiales bacterium]
MTHPSLQSLVVSLLLALVFCVVDTSSGEAQQVLESGGVEFSAPSIIELRSTNGDSVDVQEITGRATATAHSFSSGSATASAESTVHVCETPCRFQLERPMEVRVDVHALRLRPDGTAQRYIIEPQNRGGHALGLAAIALGSVGVATGGILVGIDALPGGDSEYGSDDRLDMGRLGLISLASGGALFIVGVIAMVASKGRIERVDGFDF